MMVDIQHYTTDSGHHVVIRYEKSEHKDEIRIDVDKEVVWQRNMHECEECSQKEM